MPNVVVFSYIVSHFRHQRALKIPWHRAKKREKQGFSLSCFFLSLSRSPSYKRENVFFFLALDHDHEFYRNLKVQNNKVCKYCGKIEKIISDCQKSPQKSIIPQSQIGLKSTSCLHEISFVQIREKKILLRTCHVSFRVFLLISSFLKNPRFENYRANIANVGSGVQKKNSRKTFSTYGDFTVGDEWTIVAQI